MSKILFRAGKSPLTVLSHEQSMGVSRLGVFGSNSGNMLFYSAVHRALSTPEAEIITDGYKYERLAVTKNHVAEMNETYDRYVLPLANSYRHTFLRNLNRYSDLIDQLTIPVSVVGVGAQMPYGTSFDELDDEYKSTVLRFSRAVLERSPSIGVRGEYTADMLSFLGIPESQIHIIGCPSLFMYGPTPQMRAPQGNLSADAQIALSYTPHVPGMADFLTRATEDYSRSVVIPQQHHRLALMLWGENSPTTEDPRLPIHTDHPLYRQDRMRFFVDAEPWIDYLRDHDFVVGTRIHGTVAGVLAQAPSLLLAHDSRTAELAQFHGIPYKITESLTADLDLQELYEAVDPTEFGAVQTERFSNYVEFLDSHGLQHVLGEGDANPAYDAAIQNAAFPPAVHTLMAEGDLGREQIISRLMWLRQGALGDRSRPTYAYKPPVHVRSRRLDVTRLEERIGKLEKSLTASERTIKALQKKVQDQTPVPLRRRVRSRLGAVKRRILAVAQK